MRKLLNARVLRITTLTLILSSLALNSLEAVMYYGFSAKYLHIYPELLNALTAFFLIVMRCYTAIPQKWITLLFTISLVLLIFSSLLGFTNQMTHPNFVFSTLSLHPELVAQIGILASLYGFLLISYAYIKEKLSFLLLLFPIWLIALVTTFWLYFPDLYFYFKLEDSVIEYLTFGMYIAAMFFAAFSLKHVLTKKKIPNTTRRIISVILITFIIGSFFVAGEEISWGQRLIGFETPERVMLRNDQNEFNIHNIPQFMNTIYYLYALITFFAITASLFAKKIVKKFPRITLAKILLFFSPPGYLSGFFWVVFFFSLTRLIEVIPEYPNYPEETIEFILGTGIALTIYAVYKRIVKHTDAYKGLLKK